MHVSGAVFVKGFLGLMAYRGKEKYEWGIHPIERFPDPRNVIPDLKELDPVKLSKLAVVATLPLLAACVVPAPYVSAYNGDSVNITLPVGGAIGSAYTMANQTCARGGKGTSELASSRVLPNYGGTDYLFLCLD